MVFYWVPTVKIYFIYQFPPLWSLLWHAACMFCIGHIFLMKPNNCISPFSFFVLSSLSFFWNHSLQSPCFFVAMWCQIPMPLFHLSVRKFNGFNVKTASNCVNCPPMRFFLLGGHVLIIHGTQKGMSYIFFLLLYPEVCIFSVLSTFSLI